MEQDDDGAVDPEGHENEIRTEYDAYCNGDIDALLAVFADDLEWTFLGPSLEDPLPQTCHGLAQMRRALRRQISQGLKARVEEVLVRGDHVVAVIHTPGLDQHRSITMTVGTVCTIAEVRI